MFVKSNRNETCLRFHSNVSCLRGIGASSLPKPKLSLELEKKLRDYYRPLNKEFEQLVDTIFGWTYL